MQAARKLIIGGNWKCHNTLAESETLLNSVVNNLVFDTNRIGKTKYY